MIELRPPIPARSTDELLRIAFSEAGTWQMQAVEQAKEELLKRGYDKQAQIEYERLYISKLKLEQEEDAAMMQARAQESYTPLYMIYIFLAAPILWVHSIPGDKGWVVLKQDGYHLKFKQRIGLLTAGWIFWFGLLSTRI